MKATCWLAGLVALFLAIAIAYFGSGAYNIAADAPHWTLTHSLLEGARARSIERHSAGIDVPSLDDAALVTSGAGNYDAMCAGCHLKPGVDSTELSRGLYPAPPRFIDRPIENPAGAYWVIKHGIKMSGMPAWGKSMDDRYVWGLVAFLNKLPDMSADQYRDLVDRSGGHKHGGSEGGIEAESLEHEHEPGTAPHTHGHEDNPSADDHSKAPAHQH
jgi:mono/diheme cytochrome c family protein